MRVRQSHLSQFGKCARQYYYSHILQLGEGKVGSLTVFGTVVHFALDVYEQYGYNVDLAHRTFDHYWQHPEELGERIDFWHRRTSFASLAKRGHDMINAYHDLSVWRDGILVGTEISFEVPIGDHTIHGTIDKLWARKGQHVLQVVDFKTGAAVPEKLKYNIQFTTYCYATTQPEFWEPLGDDLYEKYKNYKRQGVWYHARRAQTYNAGYRDYDDYRRLLLAVDQMDKAIQLEAFPLDYQGENCGYCPFADEVCGSEFHLKEETDGRIRLVPVAT